MNTKLLVLIAAALVALSPGETFAQATWGGGDGNWNDSNWSGGSGPGGSPDFGNTVTLPASTGTVDVTADLWGDVGEFGALTLQGGVLNITPTGTIRATGDQRVNNVLNIQGTFISDGGLDVLRDGAGTGVVNITGNAIVQVANNLDTWWDDGAELIITGAGAEIEVNGTFYLGTGATMTANINSGGFSTVFVPGAINFPGGNGTLVVNFVDGYSPNPGTSWVLFDGTTRGGTIPIVELPDTGVGELLFINYGEGGEYGQLVTLEYTNTLNLQVDSTTGAATLGNPFPGGNALDIDGYIIRSASDSLLPAGLTGLGNGWAPGLPPSQSASLLSETNFDSSAVIASGQSYPLGSLFNTGGSQDLTIEFHLAGGRTLPGTVQYVSGGLRGDYNGNGELDAEDLDWQAEVSLGQRPFESKYDENNDSLVNGADREIWLNDLKQTWFGDSNFDFEFNTADFVQVFTEGKYETGERAGWYQGDWTGDLVFDTADFVASFTADGYERGPFPGEGAVAAVPEPASLLPLLCGLLAIWRRHR